MATREERLLATQRAYAEWEETAPIATEYTDETGLGGDDTALLDKLLEIDPELSE